MQQPVDGPSTGAGSDLGAADVWAGSPSAGESGDVAFFFSGSAASLRPVAPLLQMRQSDGSPCLDSRFYPMSPGPRLGCTGLFDIEG